MSWPKPALNQRVAHRDAKGAPPARTPRANVEAVLAGAVGGVLKDVAANDARLEAIAPPLARAMCAVLGPYRAGGEIPPQDVKSEQLMLAIARAGIHFGRSQWPAVVGRWVELEGVRFACEVLVGAGGTAFAIAGFGPDQRWRACEAPPIGEELAAFAALREELAHADETAWQDALQFAARHRRSATPAVCDKLAYAFAQPEWARESLDATLASLPDDTAVPASTLALLSVLSDSTAAQRLVEVASARFSHVRTSDEVFRLPYERWDDQRLPGLASHVFDFAARVGESAVPVIDALLASAYAHRESGALLRRLGLALTLFDTDAAAQALAERLGRKDLDKLTTEYFRAHPELAIRHLSERAKKKSQVGAHARTLLEEAQRMVKPAQSQRAASLAPLPDADSGKEGSGSPAATLPLALVRLAWRKRRQTKADAAIDPRYFMGLPDKALPLPRWVRVEALPPLLLRDDSALPAASVEHVLEMLRFSTVPAPYIGVTELRDALEPVSRVAFARALYASFRANDHKAADFWPVRALGALGGRDVLTDLLGVLDEASFEGWEAHAERTAAVEALLLTAEPEAIHLAFDRARTLGHPAARTDVREVLEAEAKRRGIEQESLALSVIPTHGFDALARCPLPGGRFVIALDPSLQLRTHQGNLRVSGLPAEATERERAALTTLRGSVERTRGSLEVWLEDHLLGPDRGLSRSAFDRLTAHPIAGALARQLLWCARHDGGHRHFRVAEDRSFASVDDAGVIVSPGAEIRLAHPAELEPAMLRRWRELWASYELLQPFAQLDRPLAPDATFLDALIDEPVAPDALPRLFSQGYEPEGGVSKRGRVAHLGRALGPQPQGTFVVCVGFSPALRLEDARMATVRVVLAADEALARRAPALVGQNGEAVPFTDLDLRTRSEVVIELGRLVRMPKAER